MSVARRHFEKTDVRCPARLDHFSCLPALAFAVKYFKIRATLRAVEVDIYPTKIMAWAVRTVSSDGRVNLGCRNTRSARGFYRHVGACLPANHNSESARLSSRVLLTPRRTLMATNRSQTIARLRVERLEERETPSSSPWTIQTFDDANVGSIPTGWSLYSSSNAATFGVTPTLPVVSGTGLKTTGCEHRFVASLVQRRAAGPTRRSAPAFT